MEFLIRQCQGKSLETILPDLMAASSRLSEQGLSFTNGETSIILDALKEGMSAEEQQTWFKSLAARNDYRIWGIHCGSRKIGACGLKNISGKSAEYWGYIGEKEYWGRGLGKRLVSYCIEQAGELGLSSLYLKVIPENTRARRLYLASGFQESGQEANMLIMTLSL